LIEVEACLLSERERDPESEATLLELERGQGCVAALYTLTEREPFLLSRTGRRSVYDGSRVELTLENVENPSFTLLEANGSPLHGQIVPETVDDQPGQTIAFGVNPAQPRRLGTGQALSGAARYRQPDPLLEELSIDRALRVSREEAHGNGRARRIQATT
jgi:hypothetical protein